MTLFVFARAAEGTGPPLAVLRTQPTQWPVTFQLDDSLAMLPSRRLSGFARVIVEARLSKSGQALPQSGDLQIASGIVQTSDAAPLALRISKVIS
jgi:cytochrome c-type biogenesis protein CcmH